MSRFDVVLCVLMQVARGDILVYFNDIFVGLVKLFADVDPDVKNGANLLDRLIKVRRLRSIEACGALFFVLRARPGPARPGPSPLVRSAVLEYLLRRTAEAYQIPHADVRRSLCGRWCFLFLGHARGLWTKNEK